MIVCVRRRKDQHSPGMRILFVGWVLGCLELARLEKYDVVRTGVGK